MGFRFFLDDPFKESAHKPSILLEEDDLSPEAAAKARHRAISVQLTTSDPKFLQVTVVVTTLTLLIFIAIVSMMYIPKFTSDMCPRSENVLLNKSELGEENHATFLTRWNYLIFVVFGDVGDADIKDVIYC